MKTKGTQHRGVGFFWDTINVILCSAEIIFFVLPILTVYDFFFFVGVVCKSVCMWEFCLFFFQSCMYVCVCYNRDYFHFTYLITQQKDGLSVRDSMSSVRMLYDSVCLLFFYLICQVQPFSFFLPLSISVITLKSCTVPFEQERVTTKL